MENYTNPEMASEASVEGKKKRRSQKKKTQKKDYKLTIAMVAIVTAFIVFIVLVVLQDRIINEGVTKPVVVATVDIPAGTTLTQENMSNYMTVAQWPEDQIPEGAFSNGYGLIDKVVEKEIKAKELVTQRSLYQVDFYDEVEDPVEISIAVGELGRAVAGTLRAGDLVDIKSVIEIKKNVEDIQQNGSVTNVGGVEMEPAQEEEAPIVGLETEEEAVILDMNGNVFTSPSMNLVYGVTGAYAVQTVAENVRVVSVYTVGGETAEQIESAGGTMVATVVNVVVPRSMQDSIYLAMAEGEIQLARVEVKEAVADESAE